MIAKLERIVISEHEYVELLMDMMQDSILEYNNYHTLIMRGTEEIEGYRTMFYVETKGRTKTICYERIKKHLGFVQEGKEDG